MGVKINGLRKAPEEDKPTLEAIEPEKKPASPPNTTQGKPPRPEHPDADPVFSTAILTPAAEGWNPMDTAPQDRTILVAGTFPGMNTKWFYYEVKWATPPGYTKAGWYVVGTQWHELYPKTLKGWREPIGHP